MSDFDEIVKRQPPDGRDSAHFTYRVDRKAYVELRESVERLIPRLRGALRETIAALEVHYENDWRGADSHPDAVALRDVIERAKELDVG